jgi:ribosomal protein L9
MELLTTFVPPTIDFVREAIEQEKVDTKPRYGASSAADILTAAAMAKPKTLENAIYGSVSTSDVVATIKSALAHNDEAARVVLSENDVRFVEGHAEGDQTRVKQLGKFKVEIQVPGAEAPITRTVRVRAKKSDS